MKIVKPSFEILNNPSGYHILRLIEMSGRVCYKSESKITTKSAAPFVKGLIDRGHEAMLEHQSVSVLIVCDRGISHELVRHRLASYAMESQRYVNYGKGAGVTFIEPCYWEKRSIEYTAWARLCTLAEAAYNDLLTFGATPQQARAVLPNSTKTEIVMTANLREWRHFFKLRALGITGKPHPQMLEITGPMLEEFKRLIPVIFDDLEVK